MAQIENVCGSENTLVFEVETGKLFGSSKDEKAVATARKLLAAYPLVGTTLV